jgi:ubiquitin-conjugating enzyme E2 O
VSEDDIELVDRDLSIGNCVKRNPQDALGGTVIGVYQKLTLRPVFYSSINPDTGLRSRFSFTEGLPQNSDQPGGGDQLDLPPMLEDIPQEELVDANEFHCGDFVIYREKLGYVQEVSRGAILVLPDGRIVSPKDPDEVELPVHAQAKTIVAIPNDSRLPVRKACDSKPFDFSIPAFECRLGELLCTSENNLRQGTWISNRGLSENIPTVGYLVSAPLIDVHVHWICSNVFHKRNSSQRYESSDDIIPAEAWREHAVVYGDGGSPPYTAPNHEQLPKISSPRLNLGDRVRFRDPAGAAVKYPNFHRIPTRDSFGYDLNVFESVSMRTEYIVKWQDLTVTREKSTSLHAILNPELEYWPGELVCLRSENRKICNPKTSSLAFPGEGDANEWVLQPGKVGVVQTVNSRNRTTSVRWYENPQVTLLHDGCVLSPESTLGKLSNDIQEVSMYELSQYDALHRVHGEMVVIVPEKVKAKFISPALPSSNPLPATVGPCPLSYINAASIREVNSHLEKIRDFIVHTGWFQQSVKIDHISARPRHSIQRQEAKAADAIDWVGTITDTDVDGTIIVRLGGLNPYRDIKVPLEKILLIVDGEEDFKSSDSPTLPTGLTNELGSDVLSVLQQFLEASGWEDLSELYPDEELWTTDEESEADRGESAGQPRGGPLVDEILLEDIESLRPKEETPICISSDARGSQPSPPPRFQILESSPPADHRYISENSTGGTRQRMRRINQEYSILESSLPDGIYVRTWESRLDLMRVAIIGPVGTPYEFAPFVIDMHLNESFPNQPPVAYFHSWTVSSGSVNPNLFENGNICLSILGTWPSENENENWSQSKSTLLQILVSITGLVLVKEPFYSMSKLPVN